jgi:branched-chain amino acid aminotransferase
MKMDFLIEPLEKVRQKTKVTDPARLGFGRYFSDHMLIADWQPERGWYDQRIVPYAPFVLDPSAAVFHYGQEVFEGLKAYPQPNADIALFRPEMNLARLNRSAERLALPQVPAALFLNGLKQLLHLDRDWVPSAEGASLYIRPALIATEAQLGVHPARQCRFFIILSPVGAYYAAGFKPIRILVEDRLVRAAPGGTGAAKTGGNYAASLLAARDAAQRGYDQVLWPDALEHRFIEEVGAMNIFCVRAGELLTPPLSGSFLDGITRDSILQLAPTLGLKVAERPLAIDELLVDLQSGRVSEIFGTGTAAVVAPVGYLGYRDQQFRVGDGGIGKLTQGLYTALTGIQYGRRPDPFGWRQNLGFGHN